MAISGGLVASMPGQAQVGGTQNEQGFVVMNLRLPFGQLGRCSMNIQNILT